MLYFKLERDLPLLVEVQRRTGREVVPLVLTEFSHKILVEDGRWSRLFPRVISVPEIFSRLWPDLQRLDDRRVLGEIREYERRWQIPTAAGLVYLDRKAHMETRYRAQLRQLLFWLRVTAEVVEGVRPAFLGRGGHQSVLNNTIDLALTAHGIPHLAVRDSTLPGRICYTDRFNRITGWQYHYDRLKADRGLRQTEDARTALELLQAFRARPTRPAYVNDFSTVKTDLGRDYLDLSQAVREKLSLGLIRSLSPRRFDRVMKLSGWPGQGVYDNHVKVFARKMFQTLGGVFNERPDLRARFIYYPLQYFPEVTIQAYGRGYEDQVHLITRLAASIPTDTRIYVKEHTSMVGRRPFEVYRRLKKLFNVELVSPLISTFDLIKRAAATATITSTAGWEAYNLGLPAICFGHAFYADYKNVRQLDLVEGLDRQIQDYLAGFQPDREDIEDSYIALYLSTYPGQTASKLASGEITTPEGAAANARLVCQSLMDQLELRREMGIV
jgi:hypothetical protein